MEHVTRESKKEVLEARVHSKGGVQQQYLNPQHVEGKYITKLSPMLAKPFQKAAIPDESNVPRVASASEIVRL